MVWECANTQHCHGPEDTIVIPAEDFSREMVKVMPSTVDPNREISHDEVKALVTIGSVERLMVRAHSLMEPEEGETRPTEEARYEAQSLLESAIDLCTTRTVTAVKSQALSDEISAGVRSEVLRVLTDTDRRMEPLRQPKSACPECGHEVHWDTEHQPVAWRHVEWDSRWCQPAEGTTIPLFPGGTDDPNRVNVYEEEQIP